MGVPGVGRMATERNTSLQVSKDLATWEMLSHLLEGKGSSSTMSHFSDGEAAAVGDKEHGSFCLGSDPRSGPHWLTLDRLLEFTQRSSFPAPVPPSEVI